MQPRDASCYDDMATRIEWRPRCLVQEGNWPRLPFNPKRSIFFNRLFLTVDCVLLGSSFTGFFLPKRVMQRRRGGPAKALASAGPYNQLHNGADVVGGPGLSISSIPHSTRFISVLVPFVLHFAAFNQVLLGFTGFYWVLPLPGTSLCRVLLGFTRFHWVLLGFTEFYRVLPSFPFPGSFTLTNFTGFYWVLLGFTGFPLLFLALLSLTRFVIGFTKILPSYYLVFLDLTKYTWVMRGFLSLGWVRVGFVRLSVGFIRWIWGTM